MFLILPNKNGKAILTPEAVFHLLDGAIAHSVESISQINLER